MTQQPSSLTLSAAGDSHLGGQHANDDYHRVDTEVGLLAVADGLPDRPAARVAAETAVDALFEHITSTPVPQEPRGQLEHALRCVNRHVRDEAGKDEHQRGMATTLACVLAVGKLLVVGHVGDSRVMRFRNGAVELLTVDHRREGSLTRAIGLADGVVPDVCLEVIRPGDGILLATAGLTRVLDETAIAKVLLQRASSPRTAVRELIIAGLRRSALQNLTCVYACWKRPAPLAGPGRGRGA